MKEQAIAKIHLDQSNKILDAIEGSCTVHEAATFIGSHLVDTQPLIDRLTKAVIADVNKIEKSNVSKKSNTKTKGKNK